MAPCIRVAAPSPVDGSSPKAIGVDGILEVDVVEDTKAGVVVERSRSADDAAMELVGNGKVVRR